VGQYCKPEMVRKLTISQLLQQKLTPAHCIVGKHVLTLSTVQLY